MTKEELLALNLTEEQATAIIEDYGKNYVSKSQFNEKNEKYKQAKQELETTRSEYSKLAESESANETLKAQIKELQDEAAERDSQYAQKIKEMQVDNGINSAILQCGVKNPKILTSLLNKEAITLNEDGSISGLQEQIEALKQSDSYLFTSDTPKGVVPGETNTQHTGLTKEEFNKLTYEQMNALYTENPDLFNELSN